MQEQGASAELRRVPETLPEDLQKQLGIVDAQKAFAHVPVCEIDELAEVDAIIFAYPRVLETCAGRCVNSLMVPGLSGQLMHLLEKLEAFLPARQRNTEGRESTILSFHTTLLHLGLIVVGLPYSFQGQMRLDEITGSSPYGASTIAGGQGQRNPSENELAAARFQGKHVATIASRLFN